MLVTNTQGYLTIILITIIKHFIPDAPGVSVVLLKMNYAAIILLKKRFTKFLFF